MRSDTEVLAHVDPGPIRDLRSESIDGQVRSLMVRELAPTGLARTLVPFGLLLGSLGLLAASLVTVFRAGHKGSGDEATVGLALSVAEGTMVGSAILVRRSTARMTAVTRDRLTCMLS